MSKNNHRYESIFFQRVVGWFSISFLFPYIKTKFSLGKNTLSFSKTGTAAVADVVAVAAVDGVVAVDVVAVQAVDSESGYVVAESSADSSRV